MWKMVLVTMLMGVILKIAGTLGVVRMVHQHCEFPAVHEGCNSIYGRVSSVKGPINQV